jgi:hypothetical protein
MLAAGDKIMLKIGALLPRAYHGEFANHKEME